MRAYWLKRETSPSAGALAVLEVKGKGMTRPVTLLCADSFTVKPALPYSAAFSRYYTQDEKSANPSTQAVSETSKVHIEHAVTVRWVGTWRAGRVYGTWRYLLVPTTGRVL